MEGRTDAIAVFVKTPGLSPVKTRLARSIGEDKALEFYRLSIRAIEAVIQQTISLTPASLSAYWAVAEEQGMDHPCWKNLNRISQGEGNLGDRLSTVYDELLRSHSSVFLIGGDSPQITADTVLQAMRLGSPGDFVLGRATDGGFYLFGGSRPVPRETWSAIPYSVAQTADFLLERMSPLGSFRFLPELVDVDDREALLRLKAHLDARNSGLLPEQAELLRWIGSLGFVE